MMSPPTFSDARMVRRGSMRPCAARFSRRVFSRSSGSTSAASARFACGDLGVRHLREILALQHLARRDGELRVDLDLGLLVVAARRSAPSASRARVSPRPRASPSRPASAARPARACAIIFSISPRCAPEQLERRVEERAMLALLHEDGMERPVEIVARADAGRLHRADRIDHRGRADGQPGFAQRAGEIDDVVGDPAAAFARCDARSTSRRLSVCHPGSVSRSDAAGTHERWRCRQSDAVSASSRSLRRAWVPDSASRHPG